MKFRKEFDSIGSIKVPSEKYWGASTQRSKKYFDIGEFLVRPVLIKSIAIIKKAAATVHVNDRQISPKISNAISTRLSVEMAGLLEDGFELAEAAEVCIYPFFDEDGGVDSERTYMKQVVQKYCGTAEEDIFNADEVEEEEEMDY